MSCKDIRFGGKNIIKYHLEEKEKTECLVNRIFSLVVVLFSHEYIREDEEEEKLVPIGVLYKIKTIGLVSILLIQLVF
jgi:hypothetical protein